MYKNKLQELAQRNYVSLPVYSCIRDGPDHGPRFKASVTYNGQTYESPGFFSSYKQAQQAAAEVALNAISQRAAGRHQQKLAIMDVKNLPHATSPDPHNEAKREQELDGTASVLTNGHIKKEILQQAEDKSSPPHLLLGSSNQLVSLQPASIFEPSEKGKSNENRHNVPASMMENSHQNKEGIQQSDGGLMLSENLSDMHKNQLQELAQRGGFDLPSYSCTREGPPHAPRFRAKVTFNGETFESPVFCSTLRQAEHAAATVAIKSLSQKGPSVDESGMCKNLLQEKAQREGISLPVYSTTSTGLSNMPVFTSTVKFAGMVFSGKAAKTRKQAEKNAAMVAWSAFKQHSVKSQTGSTSGTSDKGAKEDHGPNAIVPVLEKMHVKEDAIQQSQGQREALLCTMLGASSLTECSASEASNKATNEEPEQNMCVRVLANRHKEEEIVHQQHNRSSPTKFPPGTRIRVSPQSKGQWVAVDVSDHAIQVHKDVA